MAAIAGVATMAGQGTRRLAGADSSGCPGLKPGIVPERVRRGNGALRGFFDKRPVRRRLRHPHSAALVTTTTLLTWSGIFGWLLFIAR